MSSRPFTIFIAPGGFTPARVSVCSLATSPLTHRRRRFRFSVTAQAAKDKLQGHADVLQVEMKAGEALVVTLNDGVHDGSFIAELLVRNGLRLKMLKEEEINLEDVFMGITKGITN